MFADVLVDALWDTLKLFPFLFLLYVLIEVMEHNTGVGKPRRAFAGKWAPALGAGLGVVPMCGFSVMAAKLYEHRHITLGTLVAVFTTTSDEALLVLLLSSAEWVTKLVSVAVLVAVKLALGIGAGYFLDAVMRKKSPALAPLPEGAEHEHGHHVRDEASDTVSDAAEDETHTAHEHACGHAHGEGGEADAAHMADLHGEESAHEQGACACAELSPCEHKKENKWAVYLLSPVLHALQVAAFVLLFNLAFGLLVAWLGDRALFFMEGAGYWLQPAVCALVGAIPNCASSVILAEAYALGGIGFGGILAGLVVNAGLGYLILFRKARVRGLLILGGMLLFGIAAGYLASALALLF